MNTEQTHANIQFWLRFLREERDQKVALVVLDFLISYHASNEDSAVFPCIDTIAAKIGCSRSSVKRGINTLKRNGIIRSIKKGYGSCNEYIINFDVLTPPNTTITPSLKKVK